MTEDGRTAHLEESDSWERHELLGSAQFSLRDTVHLARKKQVIGRGEENHVAAELRGRPNSKAFGFNTPGVTRGQIKYSPHCSLPRSHKLLCGNPTRASFPLALPNHGLIEEQQTNGVCCNPM